MKKYMLKKKYLLILILINNIFYASFFSGLIEISIRPERKTLEIAFQKEEQKPIKKTYIIKENKITADFGPAIPLYFINEADESHNESYKIAKKILYKSMLGIEGIFGFYRGYTNTSNKDGRLYFPKMESEKKILVVIAKEIQPISVTGGIPTHFMIPNGSDSKWYICEGTSDTTNTKITWTAKIIPQPLDRKIPLNTIIIISDPNFISFDLDPYIVKYSENFLLPTLFVSDNFTPGMYAIAAMDRLWAQLPISETKKVSNILPQKNFGSLMFF
jgi:hypothetical protein